MRFIFNPRVSCYNKGMKYAWGLFLWCWASGYVCAQHNHVQIAQQNMPAVVAVNVFQKDGGTFSGTGFTLTENGVIVTSKHVLEQALYTNITFPNGTTSAEALVLAEHPQTDLVLLKIAARHLPTVTLGDEHTVQPGQTITVIGNPRRLQNTVTSGLISQIRPQKDGTVWLQISAPISPSSSGSPVFNERGEVIGVAFASVTGEGNQNLNFALPVSEVKNLLAQAQITLPVTAKIPAKNPFLRHIQKSWQITQRLLRRWYHAWFAPNATH